MIVFNGTSHSLAGTPVVASICLPLYGWRLSVISWFAKFLDIYGSFPASPCQSNSALAMGTQKQDLMQFIGDSWETGEKHQTPSTAAG